ncbi:DNA-binding response regulator [Halarcobacter ebronensis]|uniref:DNA-binding response regulator n=1 Tax=Halarcobacter ebronensis TaxID=1462615 RepID=A0A4Q1AQW2_9BACT|nr:response regulator transcription factor [Halarcobacter ebronensis]QKF80894.1 two-component system response regulator [Halarcobacter ebronensis]RXJ67895.1 DNA-binding response regulator [Halarcobacter ebronensis]RXK08682.1 DNA-binding response regulator [Halarcobacter ebronensis]
MKILVLEDNERLCKLIENALGKHGYIVDCIYDGEEALDKISNGYGCFILDINVPNLDGISVLESIKMFHKDTPTIIISSNHDLEKIQKSYETGCDDYLKKPFFMYELIQKVQKLCSTESYLLDLGNGFIFNYQKRYLMKDNEEVTLAKKEILLLELLAKDIQRTFSFEEIEEYVWEGEPSSLINIRALIKRIRKKIPEEAIKIVKGVGYSMNAKNIKKEL